MTVQEEVNAVVKAAKEYRWGSELYERMRNLIIRANVNIFNILRNNLLPEEYEQLDLEYCEYFRPGQKELSEWVRSERKRGEHEAWKEKRRRLLEQKKKLLLSEMGIRTVEPLLTEQIVISGRKRGGIFINESRLCSLILSSWTLINLATKQRRV